MQIDFYAMLEDKIALLDLIFTQTSYRVFDLYSPYGQALREYNSAQEVANTFDLSAGKNLVHLALWNPAHGDAAIVRKIELNPKYCNGHTFRFAVNGWSLQQLYLNGLMEDALNYSTVQGFTKKGALVKDKGGSVNQTRATDLNWPGIEKDQKQLKAILTESLQAKKMGHYWVLQNALVAVTNGSIRLERQ